MVGRVVYLDGGRLTLSSASVRAKTVRVNDPLVPADGGEVDGEVEYAAFPADFMFALITGRASFYPRGILLQLGGLDSERGGKLGEELPVFCVNHEKRVIFVIALSGTATSGADVIIGWRWLSVAGFPGSDDEVKGGSSVTRLDDVLYY